MNARGVRIDVARKAEVIDEFHDQLDHLERNLERIVLEGVGMPGFNWRSNDDLRHLFYTRLGIPAIRFKGSVTVNRNALEKMEAYTIANAIISHMSAMREIAKKRSASSELKLILTVECEHHTISQELTLEGFLHL